MIERVVVVGASLAGIRACGGLRANGFEGEITLIGDELHQPYDRPPLSKKVLAGEWEPDRISLVRPGELEQLDVQVTLGVAATGLSCANRTVQLGNGSDVAFDGLIIATGAGLRRLSQQPHDPSVFELRTLDDSLSLRSRLASGDQHVTVIGAGFIGLEVAATARQLGNDVVVLEGAPAPLIRGLGREMGVAVTRMHADHGVEIRCGVQVGTIQRQGSSLVVELGDGMPITTDVLVIGVGVTPNTGWLAGSGLSIADGVVCDETLNAGLPGVYAAGDVARWPNPQFGGEEMRVEHWTNASDQGNAAAHNMLLVDAGETPQPYSSVPFFWSEQYDKRIQFIGRAAGDDEVIIVKGSVEERSFLALYGSQGVFRGALALAMPKPLMRCRKLLLDHLSFAEALEAVQAL